MMNYYYIDTLNELINSNEKNDYIIQSNFPPDSKSVDILSSYEIKYNNNLNDINNIFIEFNNLNDITGKQIINLCNNLNVNIVIRNINDEQLFDIVNNYFSNDISKCIYPAKIVILLTLYFLYDKIIINYNNDNFKEYFDLLYNYITSDYLKSIYDKDMIINHTMYFISCLSKNEKIIEDFANNCYSIYKCAEDSILYDTNTEVNNKDFKSGLYLPLASIMRDRGYDKYRNFPLKIYNIVSYNNVNTINSLLYENVMKNKLLDDYVKCKDKKSIELDNLGNLTIEGIENILLNKNKIITNDREIMIDLFPIEIERK